MNLKYKIIFSLTSSYSVEKDYKYRNVKSTFSIYLILVWLFQKDNYRRQYNEYFKSFLKYFKNKSQKQSELKSRAKCRSAVWFCITSLFKIILVPLVYKILANLMPLHGKKTIKGQMICIIFPHFNIWFQIVVVSCFSNKKCTVPLKKIH